MESGIQESYYKSFSDMNNDSSRFKLRPLSGGSNPWQCSQTNDDVHSSISLCPVVKAVLDTPQIQRLRRLKQLGVSEMTYMTTTHTRFEHSLGVAHLAEMMLRKIQKSQPKLDIREKDILCVKLAGLCHDLGHGPFSHVFEVFLKELKRMKRDGHWLGVPFDESNYDGFLERPDDWCHEDASLMMVDDLLQYLGMKINENNLDQPLQQIGDGIDAKTFGIFDEEYQCIEGSALPLQLVLTSRDWIFIKECIYGGPLASRNSFIGRTDRTKEFLYDIVSNRHSGLDVDKMDYFARDSRRAKRTSGEIHRKFIEEAYIAWAYPNPKSSFRSKTESPMRTIGSTPMKKSKDDHNDMHTMICYPEKMVENVMNFFQERFRNHQNLYTHKTSKASEYMVCDILLLSDQFFRISTVDEGDGIHPVSSINSIQHPNGKASSVPISRAMMYPSAYIKLTDSIIDMIHNTQDDNLRPARQLINRWRNRKLYKQVGSMDHNQNHESSWQSKLWNIEEKEIEETITKICSHFKKDRDNINDYDEPPLEKYDIIVEKRKIHHGKKELNPVSFVRFLRKSDLLRIRHLSAKELPIASIAREDKYWCDMPRAFMKQTMRVFCRRYGKEEFLGHIYQQFISLRKEGKALTHLEKFMANQHLRAPNIQPNFNIEEAKILTQDDYSDAATTPGQSLEIVSRKRALMFPKEENATEKKKVKPKVLKFDAYDSP